MNNHHLSPLELARFNMIEQQIRPWNVLDSRVLQLLAEVKREDFVPAAHKSLAFGDFELPIGHDAAMLAPKVEARLVQDLQLTGVENVLEIGTGTGYTAALLGRLSHHVTTLEINPELAAQATLNLARAVVANVDVRVADGSHIDAIQGMFDVIVLSGSVAEIPEALIDKLKVGGRLIAIVGDEPVMRMTLITRTSTGLQTIQPWDTLAPRLLGFPELETFTF
ncbi:MAG: protein-L-isoaspartate O-methyltransferase [Cytophagales bacterium]|nr:protein-L-isoaspartate O-methyltransferase [Cytophagales bacterium]